MRLRTTIRAGRRRLLTGGAVTAIVLTSVSAPAAAVEPGILFGDELLEIQTHADKCFDVAGVSAEDRAPIIQFGCDDESHQRFRFRRLPGGGFRIETFAGKCLDVQHHSAEDGAPIIQYRCHSDPNQRFHLEPLSRGRVHIRTFSGKCLDVGGATLNDNAPIVQFRCWNNANQRFRLVRPGSMFGI
ncbi:RICIN domain-containing protein [Nonomuraea candida]|uniref:RICIN domain-containing protein n=1 Tax=Nonomuraea candida TaxID=359159 RepID=UPI0005BDC76E|nr:RICIN domain-containing protein [Nonomuraea candida]